MTQRDLVAWAASSTRALRVCPTRTGLLISLGNRTSLVLTHELQFGLVQ